jgi:hypothetical protein
MIFIILDSLKLNEYINYKGIFYLINEYIHLIKLYEIFDIQLHNIYTRASR